MTSDRAARVADFSRAISGALSDLLMLQRLSAGDRAHLDQLIAAANDIDRYASVLDTPAGMRVFVDNMDALLRKGKALAEKYHSPR